MTTNEAFLTAIDEDTMISILESIAKNYGISVNQAIDEVISSEAEHLLEYLTGAVRTATSVLMQKHGFC